MTLPQQETRGGLLTPPRGGGGAGAGAHRCRGRGGNRLRLRRRPGGRDAVLDGRAHRRGGGIPEITPDLGETPDLAKPSTLVAPADLGGISHFGLVRIGDDGGLQYTVEPALASITVHGPKGPVAKASTSP
ncbi:hypothetical protein ACWC4C_28145 [Streptomyces olivaceoviridis]